MSSSTLARGITATALLALPLCALAGQTVEAVRVAAVTWLQQNRTLPGARMTVEADPLDSRLRLADCPKPLESSLPGNRPLGARVSVAVHCPVPGGWTVRVPVRVKMFTPVLVTTRPLARGDGVGAGDVRAEERDITSLAYGYVAEIGQIDGRSLARPLSAGTVLTPGMLAGRQTVRIGDSVSMQADVEGVVIRVAGVAMGAGDTGTRLKVRNASSGKVLDAVVTGPGTVAVLP
ncbi:flagella basal body P-ring formation protein FlgA [Luteibacter rhizovicinus DSM 16549]|uniref:Flagella basal body P-ring formation protein FlgA n=1 Tax=Luteibacter rhizovicinus DSM 16549 TaxID=1440763 RepID=A0A0G9H8A3_9GAMM|nr:flagellar basal body P-ring formation chaperone FlgA [Luteibacter rhizovicinus]APG02819.1 flagella basal body P-ring formation protein FlgA [Luteibacter rhizovicinus DSM 16549]KLD65828.1 flagellar basal body P-ring biosynthesis protein FlgA [Luteibacter rhizovicinus DSM 16549]KLD73851.1 flagellar basal body P-ring biosynthesis protein FlgA [Xanthomonas hyacinthi DSM 19077]